MPLVYRQNLAGVAAPVAAVPPVPPEEIGPELDVVTSEGIDPAPISQIAAPPLKDVEHSADIGEKPDLQWLPKDWLYVDPRYQRRADGETARSLVRKIIEEFHWSKFQPVTVAEIPDGPQAGHYAVIDGQHRVMAAKAHPLVEDIPCWIVRAADLTAQARAFVGINRDRTSMRPLQLYRAQLAAGDPDALRIDAVVRRAGVSFAFETKPNQHGVAPPCQTQAVSTIRKLLQRHKDAPVVAALKSLAEAFPTKPDQLRGQSIEAVTLIFVKYGQRLDQARLVKTLAEHDFAELIEAARRHKELMGVSTVAGMMAAIVHAYDKGLAASKRLDPQGDAA